MVYSQQYRKPCVVASPTDAVDDVIAACRASGAVMPYFIDRGNGDVTDDEEFVVQLRDDVGPELWTESALRWSLGRSFADEARALLEDKARRARAEGSI